MNIFNPKFSLVADLRLIFEWSRRFTKWRTTRLNAYSFRFKMSFMRFRLISKAVLNSKSARLRYSY